MVAFLATADAQVVSVRVGIRLDESAPFKDLAYRHGTVEADVVEKNGFVATYASNARMNTLSASGLLDW